MAPTALADLVAGAVESGRFWVLTHREFTKIAARRWHSIAGGENPQTGIDVPGLPPGSQLAEEIRKLVTAT